jgi:hypothetical protein
MKLTIPLLLLLAWFSAAALPAQAPVISEFMSSNSKTLADVDKEFSDWIEIWNPAPTTVNLAGWSLTDKKDLPAKWVFPSVDLPAGGFLVVFASGKDLRDPAGELHTNFSLLSEGEFLGFADPAGRFSTEFYPKYPQQVLDASYGFLMQSETQTIIDEGAQARYLVPTSNLLGVTWVKPDFDDSAWPSGPTGIGFDQKPAPTLQDLIKTDVGAAMATISSSLFLRIPFTVEAADLGRMVQLKVRYDDGFVAYLNGVEVARRNVVGTVPRYDTHALAERSAADARALELIPLPAAKKLLAAGPNVLAIQAMSFSRAGPDLLMVPRLEYVQARSVDTSKPEYFAVPTPGWPNGEGLEGVAGAPFFSEDTGTFSQPFSLELVSLSDNSEIHYTLDGTEPSTGSPLYTAPIPVAASKLVKAKTFKPGLLPSITTSRSYILLNTNVTDFSSNLPIFIINTFGRTISGGGFTKGNLLVLERGPDGRAAMTDTPQFAGTAAFRVRGSSTQGQPKPNFALELEDEQGDNVNFPLLGLPSDSDWILYAPYDFDLALMRNAFIFELSNQIGRYATRSRFCEVYLNTKNGAVSKTEYEGVYTFMEKIKRGKGRVDIAELPPEAVAEPAITGGYMFKIDRLGPGETGFSAAGQGMGYVYPKEKEVSTLQKNWLRTWMNSFGTALNSAKYADPDIGYAKYIDVDAWIDHHLLNVLAKNVDALRLSTYMYKDRGGKLAMGPIWDFDRSMDSTDGRDDDPRTWNGTGDGTDYFNYPWWNRLFSDPNFKDRYHARWLELRRDKFSNANMSAIIDSMAAELAEGAVRNFQKWPLTTANGWQNEVNRMKNWLVARGNWIDSQFIVAPKLSSPGGMVAPGFTVGITTVNGDIYYTVNGPDPMATDGTRSPAALAYTGPITVNDNLRVRTRAQVGPKVWSPLVQGIYTTHLLPLVITEVMYNPAPDPAGVSTNTEFQYLEIQNVGDQTLDLKGVRIGDRPSFDFTQSQVQSLAPGELAVVVKNPVAFAARYGTDGIKVAGAFAGTTGLNKRSQLLNLLGPVDEPLLSFTYQSTWYASTNGQGRSLVIRDPRGARALWNDPAGWRESADLGGSPGKVDVVPGRQIPGDLNLDRKLTISDAIGLLLHLYGGGPALPCTSAAGNLRLLDLNGDGALDTTDPVNLLRYLFLRESPPALGLECIAITDCPAACPGD